MFFGYLCLLFFVNFINALDNCPDVEPVNPFYLEKLNGRWFETARYENYEPEKGADCGYFDLNFNGQVCEYTAHEVVNGKTISAHGVMDSAPDAGGAGKLLESATIEGAVINQTTIALDVDYDHYALMYTCSFDEKTNKVTESAWIISRSIKFEGEPKAAVSKFIQEHPFLDDSKFVWNHFTHDICMVDL